MNPEEYTTPPPAPTPNPTNVQSSQDKLKKTRANLLIVSVVAVVLLATVGLLSFRAFVNTSKLNNTYNNGVTAGKKSQADADAAKIQDISENPYRTYTAAKELGSFQVSFPRNWSLWINATPSNPLVANANPDYVDALAKQYALRFSMQNEDYDSVKSKNENEAKSSKGKITESTINVSGIDGLKFVGALDTTTPNATMIILPVRDKTFSIQTDDNGKYLSNFNDIINKLKINP